MEHEGELHHITPEGEQIYESDPSDAKAETERQRRELQEQAYKMSGDIKEQGESKRKTPDNVVEIKKPQAGQERKAA